MDTIQTKQRLHPLMATAAIAVTLASLLGIAAVTGVLPTSHGTQPPVATITAPTPAVVAAVVTVTPVPQPVVHRVPAHRHVVSQNTESQAIPYAPQYAPTSSYSPSTNYAPTPNYAPAPALAPVSQNSPVGIGIGAVVGGLLGNQVGGGNGKTLATIVGAVGGGYVGNEVAKRTNP